MLHLNDSRTTLGSRLDRHEHIGAGQIGRDGHARAAHPPWLATLPTYLETPGMDIGYDKVNLDRVRMLIDGETPAAAAAGGVRSCAAHAPGRAPPSA